MTRSIRRSAAAEQDLTDIWVSIAQDNPAAADRVLSGLLDAEERLADHPQLGRLRPELPGQLRSWSVAPYVLFYQPLADAILIVRVLHGARDIDDLLLPKES